MVRGWRFKIALIARLWLPSNLCINLGKGFDLPRLISLHIMRFEVGSRYVTISTLPQAAACCCFPFNAMGLPFLFQEEEEDMLRLEVLLFVQLNMWSMLQCCLRYLIFGEFMCECVFLCQGVELWQAWKGK